MKVFNLTGSTGMALLFVVLILSACSTPPPEVKEISLINNPNEQVPLPGVLSFESDRPVVATLTITNGTDTWTVTPDDTPGTTHEIPVLGLKPDMTYEVMVTVADEEGISAALDTLSITTPALPDDFPPIEITTEASGELEPGVTLMNLFRWTGMFDDDRNWGLLVAVDHQGDVVWYYQSSMAISEGRRMRNGNIFFADFEGSMNEIDMLGNTLNQWHAGGVTKETEPAESSIAIETDGFHHDIIEIPNGNFIGLGLEAVDFEDFPIEYPPSTKRGAITVAADEIIEFDRSGNTVRSYLVTDILDPERLGTGSLERDFYEDVYKRDYDSLSLPVDITHSNAVYYIEEEDAVIISSYHQCAIYKVDMKSGELIWILGDSYGWEEPWSDKLLTPVGELTWPCHQHGIEMTDRGTLLLFDNGASRSIAGQEGLTPDKMYSRAVEYKIDETNGTVEETWVYGPEQEHFSSVFICDADYMSETGNVLITDGGRMMGEDGEEMNTFGGHQWGRVFEVTHGEDTKKIWEVEIRDPETRYSIYRAQRLKSLYPKLDEPTG